MGFKPVHESRHASTVCTSRLTAERKGTFNPFRNSTAASLSFIAGPPTKLNPVSDTSWLMRDGETGRGGDGEIKGGASRLPVPLSPRPPLSPSPPLPVPPSTKNRAQASRLSMKVEMTG